MNCTEFEAQLQEWLDERQPGLSPPLAEHANACASCRTQWAAQRVLLEAVGIWKSQLPAVDIANRVWQALAADAGPGVETPANVSAAARPLSASARIGSSRRILAMATVAAAAAILFAVAPARHHPPGKPQAGAGTPPGGNAAVATARLPRTTPATDLGELVQTAQAAYSSLAHETVVAVRDAAVFVPSAGPSDLEVPFEKFAAETTTTWISGLKEDLQPIRTTVGEALGFLWGALPAEPDPTLQGS